MKPVKLYYFLIPHKKKSKVLRDLVESTREEESESEHTRRRRRRDPTRQMQDNDKLTQQIRKNSKNTHTHTHTRGRKRFDERASRNSSRLRFPNHDKRPCRMLCHRLRTTQITTITTTTTRSHNTARCTSGIIHQTTVFRIDYGLWWG